MKERNAFDEAGRNFHSKIGKKYFMSDVLDVWREISKKVRKVLLQGKGINLKGLGIFTISEWKLNVGTRFLQIKNPVFFPSEKLVQLYGLRRKKVYTSGRIPVETLNLSGIATSMGKSRQMVEDCVSEVLLAFSRILSDNANTEFYFSQVGVLQIKNKLVNMKFFPEFLTALGAGRDNYVRDINAIAVEGIQSERENTALSEKKESAKLTPVDCRCSQDSISSGLPKSSGSNENRQETHYKKIEKQGSEGKHSRESLKEKKSPLSVNCCGFSPKGLVKACKDEDNKFDKKEDVEEIKSILSSICGCSPRKEGEGGGEAQSDATKRNANSRNRKAGDRQEAVCCKTATASTSDGSSSKLAKVCSKQLSRRPISKSSSKGSSRSSRGEKRESVELPWNKSKYPPEVMNQAEPPDPDPELCYNCQLQDWRALRHRPVGPDTHFKESCKERAVELSLLKDVADAAIKDMVKEDARRKANTDLANYNKMMAEERQEKERQEALKALQETSKSYVLYQRPDSPKGVNRELAEYLEEQMRDKESREKAERDAEDAREREKQKMLAEDVERQRWESARERDLHAKELKFELEAQVNSKKDLEAMFPENEGVETDARGVPLGFRDTEEQRRLAGEIRKFQEYQAKCKREKEQKEREDRLKEETKWLKEIEKEAKEEALRRAIQYRDAMAGLHDSWAKLKKVKEEREKEEIENRGCPRYLLEEIIRRCKRCDKKLGHRPERLLVIN